MYLQSIRFTNLTLEDWRFTFRLLSLPVLIPLLAWIYNDFNNDIPKLQVMEYLSNHNHLSTDKEIAGKSFYNNNWNSKYFEYKSEIPEVSESLKNRLEFYSKVKEYGIPLMALALTSMQLYFQKEDYTIGQIVLLWAWGFITVPVIIPPLLDFELYSYEKYNDIVPDIYESDGNGLIGFLIFMTGVVSSSPLSQSNPSGGMGYLGLAILSIAEVFIGLNGLQQKNIKTVRYIYEMQKFEKENKR